MTWLITGAKGQLGRSLSSALGNSCLDFRALDSKELDITNQDQVHEVIGKIKPRIIVNSAAWTDVDGAESNPEKVFEVNTHGVMNLILAAQSSNSILIQISSDYVFSGKSEVPILENAPLNPISIYGESKAEAERLVKQHYPHRSYILRTAWLYSEFGRNFAKVMLEASVKSIANVQVVQDQVGQPTNANDLAIQIIGLANSNANFGVYHGTNSGQASWYEFAQEVFKLTGSTTDRVTPIESTDFPRIAKRPMYSVLSHSSWTEAGLAPMQDWRAALKDSIGTIGASIAKSF